MIATEAHECNARVKPKREKDTERVPLAVSAHTETSSVVKSKGLTLPIFA